MEKEFLNVQLSVLALVLTTIIFFNQKTNILPTACVPTLYMHYNPILLNNYSFLQLSFCWLERPPFLVPSKKRPVPIAAEGQTQKILKLLSQERKPQDHSAFPSSNLLWKTSKSFMLHIRYLHHLIINVLHKFLIWLFIRATLVFYLFLLFRIHDQDPFWSKRSAAFKKTCLHQQVTRAVPDYQCHLGARQIVGLNK